MKSEGAGSPQDLAGMCLRSIGFGRESAPPALLDAVVPTRAVSGRVGRILTGGIDSRPTPAIVRSSATASHGNRAMMTREGLFPSLVHINAPRSVQVDVGATKFRTTLERARARDTHQGICQSATKGHAVDSPSRVMRCLRAKPANSRARGGRRQRGGATPRIRIARSGHGQRLVIHVGRPVPAQRLVGRVRPLVVRGHSCSAGLSGFVHELPLRMRGAQAPPWWSSVPLRSPSRALARSVVAGAGLCIATRPFAARAPCCEGGACCACTCSFL